eukprot:794735_1
MCWIFLMLYLFGTFMTQNLKKLRIHQQARELITDLGYPLEEHFVTTSDGFILQLFRIPYGRRSGDGKARPAVLLGHGILDSSVTWVLNGPEKSLGFLLADNGYDVWMGNARGNLFSRKHTTLTPEDKEFWQWSFTEQGRIDVPATVNYILKTTNQRKIGYIGHSQGCTQMFVNLASPESVSQHLWMFVAMAPAVRMADTRGRLFKILAKIKAANFVNSIGFREVAPQSINVLERSQCHELTEAMYAVSFLLRRNYNETDLYEYMKFYPGGTSIQNLDHWAQLVRSGRFQDFDFGRSRNLDVYGTRRPPKFDFLHTVFPPTLVFYSESDVIVGHKDILWTIRHVPPESLVLAQSVPGFDHVAFTWGVRAQELVYDPLIKRMENLAENSPHAYVTSSCPTRRVHICMVFVYIAVEVFLLYFLVYYIRVWISAVISTGIF